MQIPHSPDAVQSEPNGCKHSEVTCAFALQALPAREVSVAEAHIAACADCQRELESLRPVIALLIAWRSEVLRPTKTLQARLAVRIAVETGKLPTAVPAWHWSEPDWKQVASGIECKLLATDAERHRVSMLVRLAAGTSYPAHVHSGAEELHLLDGELLIDGRKLYPGDYKYSAPGTRDEQIWSESGCTCLLIASTKDRLANREQFPAATAAPTSGKEKSVVMTAYRCYLLGEDGKIKISKVIECPTDAAAMQEAERRFASSGFPAAEIWDKGRRVGIISHFRNRSNKATRQTETP